MKAVCMSIDVVAHFMRWWNVGGDPMTGVRAYCINGVHDGIVVACVWCEIEGLMGAASVNDGAWGWHTNTVVVVCLLFAILLRVTSLVLAIFLILLIIIVAFISVAIV